MFKRHQMDFGYRSIDCFYYALLTPTVRYILSDWSLWLHRLSDTITVQNCTIDRYYLFITVLLSIVYCVFLCVFNCIIPYLDALEVCSRRDAIQIHAYLYLTFT